MHLPVGSIITALDDTSLNSSRDAWSTYLLEPTPAVYKQGWCASVSQLTGEHSILGNSLSLWLSTPSDTERCCTNMNSSDEGSSLSCFVSFGNEVEEYCIDPVPILSKTQNRCTSSASCLESQSCVQPRGNRDLLRITVRHQGKGTENERVVLWSGPMYEIWEQGMTLGTSFYDYRQFLFISSNYASCTTSQHFTAWSTPCTHGFPTVRRLNRTIILILTFADI